MLMRDKVVVVTGGSRGIGRAIVQVLSKEGARVAFNYLKAEKEATELAQQLKDDEKECLPFKGSVSDRSFVKEMIKEIKSKWGRIDVLVNNAGIIRDRPLLLMSEGDWNEVLSTNLMGAFYFCKEILGTMMAQRQGRIINISSLTAIAGRNGQTNYGSAKAGLIGFTKSLAREAGPFGILVNAITAGLIDTQMTKKLPREILLELKKMIPLGRIGAPEEVAKVVLFLASDLSSYMTGAVLNVSGGEYM